MQMNGGRALTAWHTSFSRNNPYHRLLAGGLEASGVSVRGLPSSVWLLPRMRGWRRGDVLHLHWLEKLHRGRSRSSTLAKTAALLIQLWWLRMRGVKMVWTLHNLDAHESSWPRLERWAQRWVARRCDRVLAHCGHAKREFLARCELKPSRVTVVPHGNYIGAYPPGPGRAAAREMLGLAETAFVVLFLGELRGYKGVEDLIGAFAAVRGDDLVLVVAGRPASSEVDQRLVEAASADPRVAYRPGFVADDELVGLLDAADVMCLPFRRVLTSGSMILAMSHGLPIVTRAAGCLPETGRAPGVFFFGGDTGRSLREALVEAYERRTILPLLGAKAKAKAARWRWDRIGRRMASLYRGSLR